MQNVVRVVAGLPPKSVAVAKVSSPASLSGVLDDYAEDAFKLICVWSHARIGASVSQSVVVPAVSSLGFAGADHVARAAGWIIALGTPAGHYSSCDVYSDALGDSVHLWFASTPRRKQHWRRSGDEEDGDQEERKRKGQP